MPGLERVITQHAVELGFDLVGFAHAERFEKEGHALQDWLKKGYQGAMAFMDKAPERRSDPRRVLEGARGIVVLGLSYCDIPSKDSPLLKSQSGRVARYALGRDYHKTMEKKLKILARVIQKEGGPETHTRFYVDTGPVLEGAAAKRAGLGFIGKNTLLIHPRFGSWILLGEIITNLDFESDHKPVLPDCGTCRLCLDACPTDAFAAPFELDARKCISYQTIEQKGPIPVELRPQMGDWVFGCDICQDVCPFNRKAKPARSGLEERAAPGLLFSKLMELRADEKFRECFRGWPLLRSKREGLLRNAAVAAGNSADENNIPFLAWAIADPSGLVRQHAAWALGHIGTTRARSHLVSRLSKEKDPVVIDEIQDALRRHPPEEKR